MSYITGQAPKVVFGHDDLKDNVTDDQAVRMLLNDNTVAAFPTDSILVNNESQHTGINLVTAANKSLTVVEGVQITGNNVFVSDMNNGGTLDFDPDVSTITYREMLQYRLDMPHNGRYRLENVPSTDSNHGDDELANRGFNHPVEISHIVTAGTSQQEVNRHNSFRYLSDSNLNNSFMSLGKFGAKLYGEEGQLLTKSIESTLAENSYTIDSSRYGNYGFAPSGTLANSGITLTTTPPTGPHTVEPEDFKTYRISYDDAKIQVTQSYVDNNVVYIDPAEEAAYGGSTDTGNLTFSNYVKAANDDAALAYHGNMPSADFNALNSSTVVIRCTPSLDVNTPFKADIDNSGIVSLGSEKPDLTGVGDQYPKTDLKVTVKPTHNLEEDSKLNSDYLSVDLVAEAIKEGAQNSDATVTFDSSNRSTVTSSFGATVDVVYDYDPLSSSAPNGVLSDDDMKNEFVSYSAHMKVPSTKDATNAAVLSNTVENNMAFMKGTGLNSHMTVSGVDTKSNNLVGKLIKAIEISSDEKDQGVLRKINNTDNTIPDFELDLTSNSFGGSDISGTINSALTEEENLASAGIRVRFQPRNLFQSSSLTEASSVGMVEDVAASSLIRRAGNVVVYDINTQFQGPMHLENVPTTGLYVQKYEVRFPSTGLKGTSINFQNTQHPIPVHVIITAKKGADSQSLVDTTDAEGSQSVTINLSENNVKINSAVTVGSIVTVDAEVLTPLRLPGVVDKEISANVADANGTAALKIPVKYRYDNSGMSYTWVNGIRPSRKICLELQAENVAYTHNMIPEGSQDAVLHSATTGTWVALCQNSYPIDLRRGLDVDNVNASLNLLCNSSYNLNLKLDVRGDHAAPSVYSVDYVLGSTYQIDKWTVQYALAESNMNLFATAGTLNKANIDTILQDEEITLLYAKATSVQTPDADNINYITTVNIYYDDEKKDQMFQVAMANPKTSHVYFARMTKALVDVNGTLNLLANGNNVKVANGITANFSGIQGTASVNQQVLSVSLNVDKYSAIAYTGQALTYPDAPYHTVRAIPNNKVLIPAGLEYAYDIVSTEMGEYIQRNDVKDADGNRQSIVSYGLQFSQTDTSLGVSQADEGYVPASWTLMGSTDNGKTWHALHQVDDYGFGQGDEGWIDRSGNTIGVDPVNAAWRETQWFNCTSFTDCKMTNVRLVIRKWPARFPYASGSFTGSDTRRLQNIAFHFASSQNGQNVFDAADLTKSKAGADTSYLSFSDHLQARPFNFGWQVIQQYKTEYARLVYRQSTNSDVPQNTYNGSRATIAYTPCPLPSKISGIKSSVYRGFPNAVTYRFHRAQTQVVVEWGMEKNSSNQYTGPSGRGSETFTIASVPSFGYFNSTFGEVDLTHQYGIKVYLSANKIVDDISLFTPNIANVKIFLNNVEKASGNAQTFTLPSNQVPFVEKYKLDHFFVPSEHDVTIYYKLAPYVVETHHYLMASTFVPADATAKALGSAGWSAFSSKSDTQLLTDNTISLGKWNSLAVAASSLPHRIFGKKFFVQVVPMIFQFYAHGYSDVNMVTRNVFLENTETTLLDLSDKYQLKAVINLNHDSMNRFMNSTEAYTTQMYIHRDPLLLTIRGVYEMPPLSADPDWHIYVDQQPFTTLHYEFDQYNTGNSSRELLVMNFSSLQMHPIYGGNSSSDADRNAFYDFSSSLVLRGWIETRLTQYVLKFNINSVTKQVEPVVVKMVAQDFNPSVMGPDGSYNVDGEMGTKDTFQGGWYKQFPIVEASQVNLQVLAKKLGKPYNFLTATDYPALGFGKVHESDLTGLVFDSIDLTAAGAPRTLDLLVNIRDYVCDANGNVTYNTNGTDAYSRIFNMPKNKRRVLSIFAKDQLVVKDHLGNLSTRIGPDGQLYTSDMLAYSVRLQSNQDATINRVVNGPLNSQVALSAPQELHIY